jgi:hypothetical protein
MVAPVQPLAVIQYAPETVAGTLLAATRVVDMYPGSGSLKRNMVPIVVRNAGSFATAHRVYAGQESTQIDYTEAATFDRLPDIGNLFFNAVATGTGSGATRTWTFTPTDTTDGLKRFSYEVGGKDTWPSEYTVSGCVGQTLGISIKPNLPWECKIGVLGMVTTPAAKTGALSLPSTLQGDDVLWTQTKVYIDTTASSYGTTQQVGRIVSADFNLTNGVNPRHTLDGAATPYRIALSKERTLEVTVVAEYDSQTQYTAWAAATPQRVQLKATGASSRAATLNVSGYWDVVPFGNDNGVITTQMKLKGLYDATTLASDVQLIAVNGVTTLTTIP